MMITPEEQLPVKRRWPYILLGFLLLGFISASLFMLNLVREIRYKQKLQQTVQEPLPQVAPGTSPAVAPTTNTSAATNSSQAPAQVK